MTLLLTHAGTATDVTPVTAANLPNRVGWWKASDLDGSYANGDPITTNLADHSGAGHDLVPFNNPTFRQVASNGHPAFRGGSAAARRMAAAFALTPPFTLFVVMDPGALENGSVPMGGFGADRMYVYQVGGSWRVYAGAGLVDGAAVANTAVVLTVVMNGGASSIRQNLGAPANGDAGGIINQAGISLGTDGAGGYSPTPNLDFFEAVIATGVVAEADIATVVADLKARNNIA